MNELNIFSYIQKNSSFYNLVKNDRDLEKLSNAPNNLRKFLKQLSKSKDRKKLQRDVLNNLKTLEQGLETLKRYASFEASPKKAPSLIGVLSEMRDLLQEMQMKWNPETARRIEGVVPRLEKSLKVLEDSSCLEHVVKATKNLSLEKCKRHLELLREAYGQKHRSKILYVQLVERGIFGASQDFAKYLFEVGLEMDPYMNVPVIPASSIKGAVRRAYETLQPGKGWPPPEKVFGTSKPNEEGGEIGAIIFTDGYPVKAGRDGYVLYPDVLTPHYPDDLMGELDHDPQPISHLSIAPETCFGFVIAYRRDVVTDEILNRTIELAIHTGIGAKTSTGYGRFRLTEVAK